MKPPIVIALGGNALIQHHQLGDFRQQLENVSKVCELIAETIPKNQPIVITHGNGPQVGNLELQMKALSPKIPSMPLDVETAMTQGQIGHMLFFGLDWFFPKKEISIVGTHVEVAHNDPAFANPSKPIGPWYGKKEMQTLKQQRIPLFHDPKKGWRRVVPSPMPKRIISLPTIRALLEKNHIVIACGGGGIPVMRKGNYWHGAEAVIDKDLSSQVLANSLHAKQFVMLTDEDYAYLGYSTKHPLPIKSITPAIAEQHLAQGEFGKGSMHPKVLAGIRFVRNGGKEAFIGHTQELDNILQYESGTCVRKE
ncbi:MAG: carbamate kinase [Candidatus Iainarchaeum archaeon]|uniref:Carbamate kinase n=1 Tax=Candidatus Iainarchaeum sp. TaxID=3101447 RepID=A0A7T9DJE8_9ARCH|nr:MAG: carbamate kinase [Candidatus Diapherotrites archaeon]